ncbi:MAG: signal peptidase I [Pikeienuella sp.]
MAKSHGHQKKDGIGETIKTVVYAILIAVVFRSLLFQPFWIPSGSMKSTLLIGDYIFVSKYSYGLSKHSFPFSMGPFEGRILGSEPERGDVVVFRHPKRNEDFVKRLTGLPGDRIQMKGGVLHINDVPAKQTPDGDFVERLDPGQSQQCVARETRDGEVVCIKQRVIESLPNGVDHVILNADTNRQYSDNTPIFTVPDGHYFFMGDNRDNSNDSRQSVGFVPFENLLGRAEIIAISADGPFYEIWNWRFDRFLTLIR